MISYNVLMLEQYPIFNNNQNRTNGKQIYEYLSKVMQQFTYFFRAANTIMALYIKDEKYQMEKLILEIQGNIGNQKLMEELDELKQAPSDAVSMQKYNYDRVYRRFVCRMIEVILPVKQQLTSRHKNSLPMLTLIKHLQSIINIFQKDSNLHIFIQNLLASFNNFIKNVKNIDKCQFLSIRTKHELIPRPNQQQSHSHSNQPQNIESVTKNNIDSTRKYKKTSDGLSLRYNTLACLDIDYQYFRSSYFMAKNQHNFLEQCLQRNKIIKSNILQYSKQFKKYLVKRQAKRQKKKLSFRTSINKEKIYKNKNSIEKINLNSFIEKRMSVKVNNWAGERNRVPSTRFTMENQKIQSDVLRPDTNQMRRTNYHMKNILITASKLKIGPLDSPSPKNTKPTIKVSMQIGWRKNNWRSNMQQYKRNNKSYF